MDTEEILYIEFAEAVVLYFELMFELGETRIGIASSDLIESALARPFLHRNGFDLQASLNEIIEFSLNAEADVWKVDDIENWLRIRVKKI